MKMNLSHFILFAWLCFCGNATAQITGTFLPIKLESAVKSADAIYHLKITEAKTHGYSHKNKQYYCGIEYKANLIEVLKGSEKEGKTIRFSTWVPLTVQTKYLVFLRDLSQPFELPKGAKYVKGFKAGRLNRVDSKEDKNCEKGLPLLRTDFERDIFEFDKDLEFKTKKSWLRYTPIRASIALPGSVKEIPLIKQCGEPLGKNCLFNEIAIRWEDLSKAVKEIVGQ